MSQEANPYLVTSVGLVTKMPYSDIEILMKQKREQRIENKNREKEKAAKTCSVCSSRTRRVDELHGKHRVHHNNAHHH
jgi:hypothetical protein